MLGWDPPPPQALVRCALLAATFALLVVSARHLPVAIAGYVLLLGAVFVARADEHVFPLWLLYGFVYWSLSVGAEDNAVLLTLTTIAQILGLGAAFLFPATLQEYQRVLFWAAGALLVLPIQCNNPYYTPAFSILRVLLYVGIELLQPERLWVVKQYPLFAKREVLVLLLILHAVATRYLDTSRKRGGGETVLPLTTSDSSRKPLADPVDAVAEEMLSKRRRE